MGDVSRCACVVRFSQPSTSLISSIRVVNTNRCTLSASSTSLASEACGDTGCWSATSHGFDSPFAFSQRVIRLPVSSNAPSATVVVGFTVSVLSRVLTSRIVVVALGMLSVMCFDQRPRTRFLPTSAFIVRIGYPEQNLVTLLRASAQYGGAVKCTWWRPVHSIAEMNQLNHKTNVLISSSL